MDDESYTTLSLKAFLNKVDSKIMDSTDRLISNGMGNPLQDNILRGKILAFKEVKEILLNKNL